MIAQTEEQEKSELKVSKYRHAYYGEYRVGVFYRVDSVALCGFEGEASDTLVPYVIEDACPICTALFNNRDLAGI